MAEDICWQCSQTRYFHIMTHINLQQAAMLFLVEASSRQSLACVRFLAV
jgi:hypothetical protein